MSTSTRIELSTAANGGVPLSPEHKRFQTLRTKLDKARDRLQAWQANLPLFAAAHGERVAPMLKEFAVARRQWAFELEDVLGAQRWAKPDAASLRQMIVGIAGELLDGDENEEPDAELKALYNRHSDDDYDSEDQAQLQSMKEMLESMGGVDLGDEPVQSAEDLMRRAQAQMHEQMRAEADAEQAALEARRNKKPRKTKSAAQLRAEAEAERITQTVREVYRKLASALHPDRVAADAPAAERERRTTLMQAANSAYEAGDLLRLLELQLQIEQVNLSQMANIDAAQVRHFNKLLAEQLRELEQEIDAQQMTLCATYGLVAQQRLDPTRLIDLIRDELRELQYAQSRLAYDRRTLRGDMMEARRFLKQWRAEQRAFQFDEIPF